MIFYFSATGNSEWVAKQVAKLTNDKTVNIVDLSKVPDIQNETQIGFVFPIYAWGVPEIMVKFIDSFNNPGLYTFAICTCGSEAGLAMKILSKRCLLDSYYSVVMPNNYIVGSNTETKDIILSKISKARTDLVIISNEILNKQKMYKVKEGNFATIKSKLANYGFNNFARSAKPFKVDHNCIGCGQCAQQCPAKAITMKNEKPVWKDTCYQCMKCINLCPVQSIQYGKSTVRRNRYKIYDYVSIEELN